MFSVIENLNSAAVTRRLGSTHRGPGRLPAPFDTVEIDLWGQDPGAMAGAADRLIPARSH